MTPPGVYRSDVDGHLFVLKTNPLRVSCVVCMESCAPGDYKTPSESRKAAEAFTSKHGYLDEKIADNIAELIPPRKA